MKLVIALGFSFFCAFSIQAQITPYVDRSVLACFGKMLFKGWPIGIRHGHNVFPNASPEAPNYIVIDLEIRQVTLTETLVDLGDPPIYLAMHFTNPEENSEVRFTAPADAVSIVRWRKGETQIWLKIIRPSSTWLTMDDGSALPPRHNLEVAWTIGISGEESRARNTRLFEQGLANRVANSREDGVPVDTELSFDLSNYIWDLSVISGIEANVKPLGSDTAGVETEADLSDIIRGTAPSNDVVMFIDEVTVLSVKDCTENLYPWVSYNDQFNSRVIANNFSAETARIEFTATRGDGTSYFTTRELPPLGFLAEEPATLFPDLAKGPGFSLLMRAVPNAAGSWVTFSSGSGLGRSPSQGTAVQLNDPSNITAPEPTPDDPNALLFGYLPLSDGFSSAPVVVNAGVLPVDVTLYFYDQAGNLILRNDSLIKDLRAYRPFAVPTAELLPGHTGDVQMIAYTTDGPINGAVFTFNTALETAIGNAQPIRFDPADAAKQPGRASRAR